MVPLEQLRALAAACRDSGKALELNARYCPSPGDWLDIAREAGCRVSLGSDAHMPRYVGASWPFFRKADRIRR